MMKFFTKEVKIAVVAIIGIVVLFYGLQFLKGLTLFSGNNSYFIEFADVSGVAASTPIYANGYKVGVVKEIKYDYKPGSGIQAVMELDNEMKLPRGSKAEIASDLLGNIKINLVLGDDLQHMLAPGDTIPGGEQNGLMGKVGEMIPAIERMLPKLDSILTSLNMLLADPALQNSLHHIEGMTGSLNNTSRELMTLSASLNRQVPSMLQKADGVLDNTNQLTANLATFDVASLNASVNQTLANVNEMTRKLNSNEGTLGLLMRDASLYMNLSATAASADSLLSDLKAHPKRYVHFSLFGRKDK